MNTEPETYFTDTEYRILLAALGREEKICAAIDRSSDKSISELSPIVHSIMKKIEKVQYNKREENTK